MTEWDEFKGLNYESILESMYRPAFLFDGRNLLNHSHLTSLGFEVHAIGKTVSK